MTSINIYSPIYSPEAIYIMEMCNEELEKPMESYVEILVSEKTKTFYYNFLN